MSTSIVRVSPGKFCTSADSKLWCTSDRRCQTNKVRSRYRGDCCSVSPRASIGGARSTSHISDRPRSDCISVGAVGRGGAGGCVGKYMHVYKVRDSLWRECEG